MIFAAILCAFFYVCSSPRLLFSTGNIPIEGITVNGRKREEEIVKRKVDKKITGLVKKVRAVSISAAEPEMQWLAAVDVASSCSFI